MVRLLFRAALKLCCPKTLYCFPAFVFRWLRSSFPLSYSDDYTALSCFRIQSSRCALLLSYPDGNAAACRFCIPIVMRRFAVFAFWLLFSAFLFLPALHSGGARTAGTVSANPDHACHIEQKLQNIGGRCSKETGQEQGDASLQNRCDNVDKKQYCAERMHFHGILHFRFHHLLLLLAG